MGYTSAPRFQRLSLLLRMDRILNEALRIISGTTAKTSGEALQFYLGFYSMDQMYVRKIAKAYIKVLTTPTHAALQAELAQGSETNETLKFSLPGHKPLAKLWRKLFLLAASRENRGYVTTLSSWHW